MAATGGGAAAPLTLPRDVVAGVLAQAAASPAREVCGLLVGRGGRVTAAAAAANVAVDPARTFEVDPAALVAAHRAARTGGPALLGCYHSHPGGVPVPSARDAASAQPGALWLIVAAEVARLWCAEPGGFREIPFTLR